MRPKRGATTFADASEEEPQESDALEDSARTAELRRFLLTGLPPTQSFTVRPGRDTLLTGAQGTQLLLPAHVWDLPDSTAAVQVELREFYTLTDMVLAGLSTTSGPQLLETGGMLRLTATANGQPVQLRPGRYVHLRMPARGPRKPGMQLFEGTAHGPASDVDWQLPAAQRPARAAAALQPRWRKRKLKRTAAPPPFDSLAVPRPEPRWPEYPRFEQAVLAEFKSLYTARKLRRDRSISSLEKAALNRLSESMDQRIVRRVRIDFTVDSAGTLGAPALHPGTDPELGAIASAALLKLPRWRPAEIPAILGRGRIGTEHVAVTGQAQLLFAKSGRIFVNLQDWRLDRASRPRARYLRHKQDSLLANKNFRRYYRQYLDSVAASQYTREQARAKAEFARLRTQFTDTSKAAITEAGVYNELSALRLGWINCDRFTKAQELISYRVQNPGAGTVTNLIFTQVRGIMRSWEASNGLLYFDNVPAKMLGTVVALRREQGITYLALQEVQISKQPLTGLRFRPVTMAELRAALDRM